MKDYLRLYVLWAPGQHRSADMAERLSRHFDGLGMERDGVAVRVPVRFRSEPWAPGSAAPRPIDLDEAEHNAIVLLCDDYMHEERATWDPYVRALRNQMALRGDRDVYVPFASPTGERILASDAEQHTHYVRQDRWESQLPDGEARIQRFLLHVVFRLREHFRAVHGRGDRPEPLFVSHAKADGDDTARAIVAYVNTPDHDVPLQTFYDAMELMPGDDFSAAFEDRIREGTLLAIVSDIYDSRPWCVFELTTAKRWRRPAILVDVGEVRTSRTYPYGANLPRVRPRRTAGATLWIEEVLVEALSEGLRCDLFIAEAERAAEGAGIESAIVLPRPPELYDLVEVVGDATTLIYPDPPLGRTESRILERAREHLTPLLEIKTLSQLP
jgi:hypothetical protein